MQTSRLGIYVYVCCNSGVLVSSKKHWDPVRKEVLKEFVYEKAPPYSNTKTVRHVNDYEVVPSRTRGYGT